MCGWACASIRVSAGSCAQPPGGGAVMMYASHYMSEWTSVLSLCEMPIHRGVGADAHRIATERLDADAESRSWSAPSARESTAGKKQRLIRFGMTVANLFRRGIQEAVHCRDAYRANRQPMATTARFDETEPAAAKATATSKPKSISPPRHFRVCNFDFLFSERHTTR
jgi:hypothetical protein